MKKEINRPDANPQTSAGSSSGRERTPRKERKEMSGRITIRQVRSGISTPRDQKATLRGLGFSRPGQSVSRPDTPAVRGMVRKVRHLVVIEAEEKG